MKKFNRGLLELVVASFLLFVLISYANADYNKLIGMEIDNHTVLDQSVTGNILFRLLPGNHFH